MNEILNTAKKIRKVLLYFIDTELKKNNKKNNNVLIDSKSSTELSKQYQQFSDYRMEMIETYNAYQMNEINNNNYFHVAVTYSKFNKNYQILYENKNFEKMTSNDIVGRYVEEKDIKSQPKYENEKNSYIDISIDNKDNKKIMIGDKKFNKRRKALYSSIAIPQNVIITFDENNSDNLNNKKNLNNLEKDNKIHNKDGNETICVNKKRKLKVNYYEIKLKKYCSNLILLKKRKASKKGLDPKSPTKNNKKRFQKHLTLGASNTEQVIETPYRKKSKDSKEKTESKLLNSKRQPKQKAKEKLWKIPEKKNTHKRKRAQSIKDTNLLLKTVKNLHKRNYASPKKIQKQLTNQNDSKNKEIISQKMTRKDRGKIEELNEVRKMISGSIKNKRKMFGEKAVIKWNNKIFQMGNKYNFGEQPRSIRRPLYKRANTINKVHNVFHFRGNELKLKEN